VRGCTYLKYVKVKEREEGGGTKTTVVKKNEDY